MTRGRYLWTDDTFVDAHERSSSAPGFFDSLNSLLNRKQ
jgi:hypothetical protein